MDLKPRFTNRVIRTLHDSHDIDLFHLDGDAITNAETRVKLTVAGMPDASAEEVAAACDDLTPGEHIELLTSAIRRDLTPASLKEAGARAAADPKSAEAG